MTETDAVRPREALEDLCVAWGAGGFSNALEGFLVAAGGAPDPEASEGEDTGRVVVLAAQRATRRRAKTGQDEAVLLAAFDAALALRKLAEAVRPASLQRLSDAWRDEPCRRHHEEPGAFLEEFFTTLVEKSTTRAAAVLRERDPGAERARQREDRWRMRQEMARGRRAKGLDQ